MSSSLWRSDESISHILLIPFHWLFCGNLLFENNMCLPYCIFLYPEFHLRFTFDSTSASDVYVLLCKQAIYVLSATPTTYSCFFKLRPHLLVLLLTCAISLSLTVSFVFFCSVFATDRSVFHLRYYETTTDNTSDHAVFLLFTFFERRAVGYVTSEVLLLRSRHVGSGIFPTSTPKSFL